MGDKLGENKSFYIRTLLRHCGRLLRHYTFSRTRPLSRTFYLTLVPTLSLTSQWMIELRLFHLHRESNISDLVIVIQIALRLVLNEVLFFCKTFCKHLHFPGDDPIDGQVLSKHWLMIVGVVKAQ